MPRKNGMARAPKGSGSIRKKTLTKNGKEYTYWEGRVTTGYDPSTGKRIHRTITGKTQKEVAQRMRQLTVEIDQGIYLAPSTMTVKSWLTIWLNEYMSDVKPSTVYLYSTYVEKYIIPRLGATKLDVLTAPMVQNFYNELLSPKNPDVSPLSPKTIRNIHGTLHKALQQAILVGYLRSNPTDACKLPKVIKKEIKPLEETQVADFLGAIEGHPHEYLYKIALFTGLREGELLGLFWEDLDFDQGTLTVRRQLRKEQKKGGQYYLSTPKNGRTRTITLAPTVLNLFRLQKLKQDGMKAIAREAWAENDLIFTNALGEYLSYRTVYDCYKRIVTKIGVPTARFHDLRHTYATLAIKSGDDIKTVQENLGHATASFTLDVYSHVTAQMKQESADRMEQVIRKVSQK